jgi:holliday junction DNA helicase RuvA
MLESLQGRFLGWMLEPLTQQGVALLGVGPVVLQVFGLAREWSQQRRGGQDPETVQVYTRMVWRLQPEPSQQIYGFLSRANRDAFGLLLSANGVGPKAALALLETFTVDSLFEAVLQNQPKRLTQAKGIGGKGAEKLILELRDKLKVYTKTKADLGFDLSELNPTTGSAVAASPVLSEVEAVLGSLGYTPEEIYGVFSGLGAEQLEGASEVVLKRALAWLAKAPALT